MDDERQWEKLDPDLRFGVRGCMTELALAYAIVFPLKWAMLMPDRLTWLKLAVVPAAIFATIGSLFAGILWFRQRGLWFSAAVAVLSYCAMFWLTRE